MRKDLSRWLAILAVPGALLGLVVILLLARDPSTNTHAHPKTQPLEIAFNTWIGYSAFHIADKKGFFDNHNIRVNYRVVDPLPEKNAAMLRGDLHAMGGTIDSAIISAAAGVDGRVVWMFDRSNGTDGILASEGIKTVHDLVGKQVAVEKGFVGHLLLLHVLAQHNISPTAVKMIDMKTDDAGTAFLAGKVDAAVTWEPYLSRARQRTGSRILLSSAELPPILADTLFVSTATLSTRSDDIARLVAALQEANDYWLAHETECNSLVAAAWKLPLAEVEAIMETDQLFGRKDQVHLFGNKNRPGTLADHLETCERLWRTSGITKQEINARQLVDPSFVHRLLAK